MGEVDWDEARVLLAGEPVDVGLFVMWACFSGAGVRDGAQQAFLEGHVHALAWFGGAFETIRWRGALYVAGGYTSGLGGETAALWC